MFWLFFIEIWQIVKSYVGTLKWQNRSSVKPEIFYNWKYIFFYHKLPQNNSKIKTSIFMSILRKNLLKSERYIYPAIPPSILLNKKSCIQDTLNFLTNEDSISSIATKNSNCLFLLSLFLGGVVIVFLCLFVLVVGRTFFVWWCRWTSFLMCHVSHVTSHVLNFTCH